MLHFKQPVIIKKIFLSVWSIILTIVCFGQSDNLDCTAFKTGKFTYLDGDTFIIITRDKKKQTEENAITGELTTFRIRWNSDCSYDLIQRWSTDKKSRKQNGKITKVKIIRTTINSYEYICLCADNTSSPGTVVTVLTDTDIYDGIISNRNPER